MVIISISASVGYISRDTVLHTYSSKSPLAK